MLGRLLSPQRRGGPAAAAAAAAAAGSPAPAPGPAPAGRAGAWKRRGPAGPGRKRGRAVRALPADLFQAESVGEVMTSTVLTVTPEETVETALELMVEHSISALPVVDAAGAMIGIVSDFDLLALENLGGFSDGEGSGFFPSPDESWQQFNDVKRLLTKAKGNQIRDLMTEDVVSVRASTNLVEAVHILLRKRLRRLPVVDSEGRVVGVLSRRDVIKSGLEHIKDGTPPSR